MTTLRLAAAAALFSALAAAPAVAHTGAHGTPGARSVQIRFAAVSGDAPVSCARPVPGLGVTAATARLQDLRFYISNVRLLRADGRSVPLRLTRDDAMNVTRGGNRVTLIDLEDGRGTCAAGTAAMNAVIRGTVPEGRYVGATMYLGVPFPLNHGDVVTAPRPLDSAAMAWSWQAGRKFTKIEVADPAGPGGTWATRVFNVHLGSTGCVGNPASGATVGCAASNRATLRFPRFDPARQRILIDLRALTAGDDVTADRGGAAGCMSGPTDPECAGVFAAVGVDWRPDGTGTGRVLAGGRAQTAFRVAAR